MKNNKTNRSIEINEIFEKFYVALPNPKTELEYSNNFTLLVAVILSARCTDNAVNKSTKALFRVCYTPEKVVELGEEKLKTYIKDIGLHNSKAKNIVTLSQILVKNYNSNVPNNLEQLLTLPGVGRKTANVVLNCAFSHHTIAVDTHVFRVSKRLGLVEASTPLLVEQELLSIIPEKWLQSAHNWLVLHGRYICKARSPKCDKCFISNHCQYFHKLKN